jgi:cation/acetate symporter
VAHDLLDRFGGLISSDKHKVLVGKATAFVVGLIAIVLGILFKGVNVSFLVGLAFAVAASANLPSIMMMLFWKRTTAAGITASIIVGVTTSIGLILFSPTMFELYGRDPLTAPVPLRNPGIVSIPLSFAALILVSLVTRRKAAVARV